MARKVATFLIAPLDWGLGHTTRCIPIIDALLRLNFTVIISGSGTSGSLLKEIYPQLEFRELPDYKLHYSKHLPMGLSLLLQAPFLLKAFLKERKLLDSWFKKNDFDFLITDNRLGCQASAPSVYITHQLRVAAPKNWSWTEPLLQKLHFLFYKNHDFVWVPDYKADPCLAGTLSHPPVSTQLKKTRYIGPQSRFENQVFTPGNEVLVLLSGLEPHRTLWEDDLLKQMQTMPEQRFRLIRGKPGLKKTIEVQSHISVHNHLNTERLSELLQTSKLVICRPGYSTLMDLCSFGIPAAFCPTPDQTEQEYLALFHFKKNNFYFETQKKFQLDVAIKEALKFTGISQKINNDSLIESIEEFVEYATRKN